MLKNLHMIPALFLKHFKTWVLEKAVKTPNTRSERKRESDKMLQYRFTASIRALLKHGVESFFFPHAVQVRLVCTGFFSPKGIQKWNTEEKKNSLQIKN